MTKRKLHTLLGVLALCGVAGITACNTAAQNTSETAVLTDLGQRPAAPTAVTAFTPPAGRLLASNCFQCHGTDGKNGAFDSLAGESVSELIEEMNELKTENDADEAIMKVHAQSYSDAQIRLIAEYFSKVR